MMFSQEPDRAEGAGQEGAPALPPRAARSRLLLLVARIMGERHDTLCRLSNISAGGMRADGPVDAFAAGEHVSVEVRNVHRLAGEVRWARDGAFGIRFDEALDVEAFLAAIVATRSGPEGEHVRPPRLPTCCRVEVRAAGRIHRPLMVDIAQAGARLAFNVPVLEPEMRLALAIPGLPVRQAAVRWSKDAHCGVAFLEAFGLAQLSEWLVEDVVRNGAVAR